MQTQIQQQAGPLKQQADEAFTTCLRKSRDLQVITPFALGCRQKVLIEEKPGGPELPHRSTRHLQKVARVYRGRLAKTPDDGVALMGVGEAYLMAGDAHHARLVFSRLLEVTETNARAQSDLGVALWRLGELQSASGAFRKALEIDPTYDKARANLGSMLCGEGDVDSAKEVLQVMKQAPAPAFDVEGGFARCM